MQTNDAALIIPDWSVPANIQSCVTTRNGGCSQPPFDSFNLGDHVDDEPSDVSANRETLQKIARLPSTPHWLNQVHGTAVVELTGKYPPVKPLQADASYTRQANVVCVVLTADCLPVFFCDPDTLQVAVAHAGWRGLASGVLEAVVATFDTPSNILAWLGPAIGSQAFEVGDEVRQEFMRQHPDSAVAFVDSLSTSSNQTEKRWLADLYTLARQRLHRAGVTNTSGGDYCTFTDDNLFYSYRRDGRAGRMASVIWVEQR